MKSVFWGNYKGGVAKTTSAFQVAGHFALNRKKVLLIDLDPQCSLSNICSRGGLNTELEGFCVDKTLNYILELYLREINSNNKFPFQLLTGKTDSIVRENLKQTIQKFTNPSLKNHPLHFIPSSLVFINSRINELAQFMSGNIHNIFLVKQFLNDVQDIGTDDEYKYDYVFFDCPPTTNMLTQSVFLASDYYIIPTICDEVSTKGVPDYIVEIEKTRNKYSLNDQIRGVLIEKVFPYESKSKLIGVFETLYKERRGSRANAHVIQNLDHGISQINEVDSVISAPQFESDRYNGQDGITTKNIFYESIDNRDARLSGESVPRNTANAIITEEYKNLALMILKMI